MIYQNSKFAGLLYIHTDDDDDDNDNDYNDYNNSAVMTSGPILISWE
jgi:hypothetical protein